MKIVEVLDAYGHENIRSTHKTTLEVTMENVLTKCGDCIIAVGSTKGSAGLSPVFKEAMKREDAQLTVTIEAGGMREVVRAWGSPRLSFLHPTDLVIRKSDYVCSRNALSMPVKQKKTWAFPCSTGFTLAPQTILDFGEIVRVTSSPAR